MTTLAEGTAPAAVADQLLIGSICTGFGGLDRAVQLVVGGRVAWVADNDPDVSKLLAFRHPDIPNLGDITQVPWSQAVRVHVLCIGFPCQDISLAGKRKGLRKGTRSGIWASCVQAIAELRPPLVVIENVRSLLSEYADSAVESCPGCMGDDARTHVLRALGRVCGDLANVGYDTQWRCLPASAAGACHERYRVFIIAWPQEAGGGSPELPVAADTQGD